MLVFDIFVVVVVVLHSIIFKREMSKTSTELVAHKVSELTVHRKLFLLCLLVFVFTCLI